jgi:peptidoglycan L-alanyl-D-glutamate endopeptidase CwlK
MPKFGKRSLARLNTCDAEIQVLFEEIVKHFDCTVLCGHRPKDKQDDLQGYDPPRTKVSWPNSKHNSNPSRAVDVAPYPIDWEDRERFHLFAGFVLGVSEMLGVRLRWGGDWDSDLEVDDNDFDDLPHFELVD